MKTCFRLVGLDCPHCSAKIERDLKKTKNVENASINLMTTRLTVEHKCDTENDLIDAVDRIVHKYEPHVEVKRA